MAGCNARPQKRLANHIQRDHPQISDRRRRQLSKSAKLAPRIHRNHNQRSLTSFSSEVRKKAAQPEVKQKAAQKTSSPVPKALSSSSQSDPSQCAVYQPIFSAKGNLSGRGSTRHFGKHDRKNFEDFHSYLTGPAGNSRSLQAAESIISDISKMLHFFDPKCIDCVRN